MVFLFIILNFLLIDLIATNAHTHTHTHIHIYIKNMKRQDTKWEKIYVNYRSDKVLIPKICEEFIHLDRKEKKKP